MNEIKNIIDFDALRITLASPEEILSWSYGEVLKPETINYRTLRTEKDGLFCERIFGPTKDWECYCGKYKRVRYRGIICDKCGVEVTHSRVRRERMGHITLAAPCAHVWFFKGSQGAKLSLLLDISPRDLEQVVYFASYLVTSFDEKGKKKAVKTLEKGLKETLENLKKETILKEEKIKKEIENKRKKTREKIKNKEQQALALKELELLKKQELQRISEEVALEKERAKEVYKTLLDKVRNISQKSLLTEDEYLKLAEYGVSSFFKAEMGAEAIDKIIKQTDFEKLSSKLRKEAKSSTGQRNVKITKRLRLIEGLKKAGVDPSWMILKVLPVIPPDLRPMVQLSGGRFATSDLNDLYRRVINRNNRLKHLIELGAPEIILRNEKRMLQESVDALIDSSHRRRRERRRRPLRSLSDMLRGKQGRFRQNLLGKRVDYSGRSVIVVGPELSLNQCGLPKEMALEIFKPYVLREMILRGLAPNVRSAKNMLETRLPEVFDILEEITKDHPILLNRAPTLHRLGIQAFYPILIEGSAIRIHPCICRGFNADFDGDQMAVHLPLSQKAKEEASSLMMPEENLLKPADGSPIVYPDREMALGTFYLTSVNQELKTREQPFTDKDEAIFAYQTGKLNLRQAIKVKIDGEIKETTVGRLIFNEILPEPLKFVNDEVTANMLNNIVAKALKLCSKKEVVSLIDNLKNLGFEIATESGVSVSLFDCKIIPQKSEIIRKANKEVVSIEKNFAQGLITGEEEKRLAREVWMKTTDRLADLTWDALEPSSAIKIIVNSGSTKASKDQIKQISAMRGLVVDPLGRIVDLPTKSNFREGLSVFEYVTSARGSRKGLTDTAIKTSDAGYLTRRLVDVAHDGIIDKEDCGTSEGIEISKEGARAKSFFARILGRVLAEDVTAPGKARKVLIKKGEIINEDNIGLIEDYKIEKVTVRSPLTCKSYRICAACYGWDLGNKKKVEVGTPVGVIAAQSIGEPGTQLTLRTKHAGGVVGLDVTQGLPRVEELFEMRTPKRLSPLAEISGRVSVIETDEGYKVRIKSIGVKPVEEREYLIPLTATLWVKDKQKVPAGTQLASGALDVQEILEVKGLKKAQEYLVNEAQKVYESQGISIHDKHFEVIVRKMSEKVMITSPGDTNFLIGELTSKINFEKENARIIAEGGEPATAQVVILGITRAAIATDSWLSAASFQNTSSVLTDAALEGKEDELLGLKENVIIGRLIPVTPERIKKLD